MFRAYCKKYGFVLNTLPAGSFSGQTEVVVCLGNTTNLTANVNMPDNVAYAITKAIVEYPDELHAAYTALSVFAPEKAVDESGLGVLLHPGVEAYYKEVGLLK